MQRSGISLSTASESDYLEAAAVGQKYGNRLGFITREAYKEAARRGELFVAKDEGKIVSLVMFRRLKRTPQLVKIDAVATAADHTGKGLARMLIQRVKSWARAKGAILMELSCPVGEPANDFYDHTGWQLKKTRKGTKRDLNVWRLLV